VTEDQHPTDWPTVALFAVIMLGITSITIVGMVTRALMIEPDSKSDCEGP
jgi:hypothetical protein